MLLFIGEFGLSISLLVYLVLMIFVIATDSPIWGICFSVAVVFIVSKISGEFLSWVLEHKAETIIAIMLYFIVGLFWSFFKWRVLHKEALKTWRKYGRGSFHVPQFNEHNREIACWVLYWPLSSLGWFLSDFIEFSIGQFRKTYQKIGLSAYADLTPEEQQEIKIKDWQDKV